MREHARDRAERITGYIVARRVSGIECSLEGILADATQLVPLHLRDETRRQVETDLSWAQALGLLNLVDGVYIPAQGTTAEPPL